MTEQIADYLIQGLIAETFNVEKNIFIWQHIGDEIDFLKTQDKEVRALYSFIQLASQTNFTLSLGKIFDISNKKYPTRCILSFLELIDSAAKNAPEIIETIQTKAMLKENKCPDNLIQAVESSDKSLFPESFVDYYLKKYNEKNLQKDINTMKLMRDKAEAHNEAITDSVYLPFDVTDRLINFVTEIISIFGMAYHSTIWKIDNVSLIKENAMRNAFFIKVNIEDLKAKGKSHAPNC